MIHGTEHPRALHETHSERLQFIFTHPNLALQTIKSLLYRGIVNILCFKKHSEIAVNTIF